MDIIKLTNKQLQEVTGGTDNADITPEEINAAKKLMGSYGTKLQNFLIQNTHQPASLILHYRKMIAEEVFNELTYEERTLVRSYVEKGGSNCNAILSYLDLF